MKYLAFVFLFSITNVYAETFVPAHAIPKESNFVLNAEQEVNGYAFFTGSQPIEGAFELVFNEELNRLDFVIVPNKKSIRTLPYFTYRGTDERPTEIHIHNLAGFSDELFNTDFIGMEINNGFQPKSGKGKFIISEFRMGYECDSPYFIAMVEAVKSAKVDNKYVSLSYNKGC